MNKPTFYRPHEAPHFIEGKIKMAITSFTYWKEEKGSLNCPPTPAHVEVHTMAWYARNRKEWVLVTGQMAAYMSLEYHDEILKAVEDKKEEENEI